MEKRRFGPKTTMKGLPKASVAKINFLSLPKEVETTFDTGYGEHNNSKWEIEIELLNHPTQEPGVMVWQTTAQVIRIEIMALITNERTGKISIPDELVKDWLRKKAWSIESDENGIINIVEL
jgi:hypothetical protein